MPKNVRKRGSSFEIKLWYWYDDGGKQIRKYVTAATLNEAKTIIQQHEQQAAAGEISIPTKTTFESYSEYFLADVAPLRCKQTTINNYANCLQL